MLRLLLESLVKRMAQLVKSHTSTLKKMRITTSTQISGNNKIISDGRNTKTKQLISCFKDSHS